ncbi:TPA: hypothetical protein DCX15_03955 [bacterium]|nr:hypothetical protein [bacterium]
MGDRKSQRPKIKAPRSHCPSFTLPFLILLLLFAGCLRRQTTLPIRVSKEFIPGYKSVLIIGCLGPEPGEFDHPTGIAIDEKENIYVTDTGNYRVQGFNSKGQPILAFGGPAEYTGMLTGVTSFKHGLLVVDRSRSLLLAFTKKGRPLNIDFTEELCQFQDLNQVAQGKKGEMFGVDGDRAIAIRGDYLYITDIDKVRKFRIKKNKELELALEFGMWGEGQGEFMLPQGITVDHEGCIYVADTLNNRIQKFSPRGKFLLALGELNKPMGIAVTRTGAIWVVENGRHRLQKFIPEIKIVIPQEIAKITNYEWLYNRGRQLESFKEFYQAIAYYQRCIEVKPDSPFASRAQLQIGRSFKKLGSIEMAFMAYDQVVEDYPRSKEASRSLLEKGRFLEELRLFEDAKRAYERIVKEYPDSKENRLAEKRIEFIEEKILGG